MTHFKQITLTALVTFFGLAAIGCDAVALQDDTLVTSEPRFETVAPATGAVTPSPSAPAEVQEVEVAETIEDLAHTATTQVDVPNVEPMNTSLSELEPTEEDAPEAFSPEDTADDTTVVDEVIAEESTEPSPIADIFEHGSEPIAWSPSGTYKLPSYGAGCRFTTNQVIQIPSNGVVDDSLVFEADAGPGATLELTVATPEGLGLVAEVDMKRGFTGRSYRQATGEAAWTDKDGDHVGAVIDGTLCFDEKLANGLDDVLAEFSLVVEIDGLYYSMGGNVLLDGAQVLAAEGFTVEGGNSVDIDLR
jgi:hypothetical protein